MGVAAGLALSVMSGLMAQPALASDKLVLVPEPVILSTMIVAFVLLIFPLNQLIFKPIFRSLDERASRIDGARNRSSQLQLDVDGVLDRCLPRTVVVKLALAAIPREKVIQFFVKSECRQRHRRILPSPASPALGRRCN